MTTYVTGDTHGRVDIAKLSSRRWPEGKTLGPEDRLVICGDFGLVWSDPPSKSDGYWLSWLESKPWGETLFVDGNHENHDILDAMPVSTWHGGRVHRLPDHPSIIHLMRGETYEVDAETWWCFGGARSTDIEWRTPGVSWWEREMPSDAEMRHGLETLAEIGHAPDYVFTHECPYSVKDKALAWSYSIMEGPPPRDDFTSYLEIVDDSLDWSHVRRWYFGHYHADEVEDSYGHHVLLYRQIVRLGELPEA